MRAIMKHMLYKEKGTISIEQYVTVTFPC